jgi:hypothetical protein
MRSSPVVRASDFPVPKSQQSWVRSQHPPIQWNLKGSTAADEALLNKGNKIFKKIPRNFFIPRILYTTTDEKIDKSYITMKPLSFKRPQII